MNSRGFSRSLTIAWLACLSTISLDALPVDHFVIFGDSFSDNGNIYTQTGFLTPPSYTLGRETDGADTTPISSITGLWHEQLAPQLGLPAVTANLGPSHGTNYAYSGSQTGGAINPPGMATQVRQFLATATPRQTGLYVFWGGTNDLFESSNPVAAAQTAVANIRSQIEQVVSAGGKYVLWMNIPSLELTPRGAMNSSLHDASFQFFQSWQAAINSLRVEHPGIMLVGVDVYTFVNKLVANPSNYGISTIDAGAQGLRVNPDSYLFWDDVHPSTKTHQLMASLTYDSIAAALGDRAESPLSDDMNNGSLNKYLWTAITPGGGQVASINGHLVLSVPGGTNHDPFVDGNNATRVLQPVGNGNFDVAAKFDSSLNGEYQGQGILVEQDSSHYLRFEMAANGNLISVTAATVSGRNQTLNLNVPAPLLTAAPTSWLRVRRVRDTWTLSYSLDGFNYTPVGTFTQSMHVNNAGPFAWNYNTAQFPAPAITASVDWFRNLAHLRSPRR